MATVTLKIADPRVSYAELQQWPDDGRQYELYDGEVIVVPAPFARHQRVGLNITELLREYERTVGGLVFPSPIDIVFTEYDVIQPDVVFFRKERTQPIDMMEAIRLAPDLAVEVVSRSTEVRDRGRKMQLLSRFRVPEYWIVDPIANRLEVYVLGPSRYSLTGTFGEADEVRSPTLTGLTFRADRLFER